MTQSFDEWNKDKKYKYLGSYPLFFNYMRGSYEAGAQSKQAEIDELQKRINICEKLRDSQFDKLWNLTQAIEVTRKGADEDFDLFLNHLSNILKGTTNEQ